jgi:hypothetical protein
VFYLFNCGNLQVARRWQTPKAVPLDRLNRLLMRAATGDGATSPSRLQHDFRLGTMNEVTARTTKMKRVTRLQRLEIWGLTDSQDRQIDKARKIKELSDVAYAGLLTRRSRDCARWRRKNSAHFKLVEGCTHARDGYGCKLIPRHCNRCNS